jgi:hypothetical protein
VKSSGTIGNVAMIAFAFAVFPWRDMTIAIVPSSFVRVPNMLVKMG